MGRVRAWARRLSRNAEVERPGAVNRHVLENFFQIAGVIPLKWAAVRLGMEAASFDELLGKLVEGRVIDERYYLDGNAPKLIDTALIKSFYKLFPGLENRIFGDHDDLCSRMHREIQRDYGIEVVPLKCVTAVKLHGFNSADYAYEYDAITLAPIGIRYQVWLDFNKPMNLRPDACAMLFYAAERRALQRYLFGGTEPELPAQLRQQRA